VLHGARQLKPDLTASLCHTVGNIQKKKKTYYNLLVGVYGFETWSLNLTEKFRTLEKGSNRRMDEYYLGDQIKKYTLFKKCLYSRYVVASQHAEIGNMVIFVLVGSTDL
jgi:hypothetical protein